MTHNLLIDCCRYSLSINWEFVFIEVTRFPNEYLLNFPSANITIFLKKVFKILLSLTFLPPKNSIATSSVAKVGVISAVSALLLVWYALLCGRRCRGVGLQSTRFSRYRTVVGLALSR